MWCKQCNIETNADICPVCGGTTVEDLPVEVYWCDSCKIPIINTIIQADKGCCPVCGGKTEYLSADLRPVFPEERLLVELLLEKEPNSLVNESLWASNNRYYINGKSIAMPNSKYECANINSIIFEPTATISLNIILQGLINAGAKTFYISPFEHNAVTRTLYHFEKQGKISVKQLFVTPKLQYDLERIKYQFDEDKPEVVVISHASNVIGLVAPVEEIFQLAKRYDAETVLDMSQTAGLVECNIGLELFDFAVFAGHKTLLGPTGISGFAMKTDINLPAILFGGTGFESANQDMPQSLPERFEMGTMNTSGVAGLNAAIKWIQDQSISSLYLEEQRKREALLKLLEKYDFISVIGNEPAQRYVGIVSCVIDGVSSDTAGQLFSERNISVRTGLHCAPLAHRFLGTFPAGTIRFSVNHFTQKEDFSELRAALDDIEENI